MSEPYGLARSLPHAAPPIVRATDLGGVTVLKRGRMFLLTDPFGDAIPDSRGLGLYHGDTRVLSCLLLRIDGERPSVLRPDPGGSDQGTIVLTNPELRRDPADKAVPGRPLAQRSLGLARTRRLDEGLSEELVLANYADHPETLTFELLLDADMADIFEVRGLVRPRRGRLGPIEVRGDEAEFAYESTDGYWLRTRVLAAGGHIEPAPPGSGAAIVVRWRREIEPGGRVTLAWSIRPDVVNRPGAADAARPDPSAPRSRGEPPTRLTSDSPALDRVVARGLADLDMLVTPGPGPGQRYLAAGIPWFMALFGRDAILASFAALLADPALAVDTLRVLAGLQAIVDDPDHDAEPGKIPHEVRDGEMARTGEVPFASYYGSADATPLWLVLLGETFDWTGDRRLVEELWPNVLAALEWMDRYGDLDGDGFIEYRRRAEGGLVHHGWKDELDAIRDRHGSVADGPIALAEVQGYAYDARVRIARLARARGDLTLARRLEAEARRLRARFEAAFWVPEQATYALALDGHKQPMDAIGSNQGHALWSGVVGPRRAAAVAALLCGPGLNSGWGIRTFAAGQPGYSPLGYHTGTVWPHDTAIAVAGLQQAGFDLEASHLAAELFEAAGTFPADRLPELYCGYGRDEMGPPVPYPVACAPQAWAAAAPLLVVRALLGMRPDAARGTLHLERPALPAGLHWLSLSGLRVGDARIDLRCVRTRSGVRAEVVRQTGRLTVTVGA